MDDSFDPDAYLQSKAPAFDPDSYLASKTPTAGFDPDKYVADTTQSRVQGLIQDPKFDPTSYALQTGDNETAFQARQALKNRTAVEKASAFGEALTEPETYENAVKGAGKFALGLAAAPLHGLAQQAATFGAPVARAVGADSLADTLENEQQTQGAESTLAGQQVEQGLRGVARNVRNFAQDHPVLSRAINPALNLLPQNVLQSPDEATERAHFEEEIKAAKNAQDLAQQKPLDTGVVAGAAKLATGQQNLSDVYSPEALAAQGARPVSPLVTESMAAAGDPINLAIPLAGEIPGVKTLAGGLVQGAGKILQAPDAIMSAIPKFSHIGQGGTGLGILYTAVHNPALAAKLGAAYGLGKVLGFAGRAMDEQGAALRSGIPSALDATAQTAASAGESAFGTNIQRGIGNAANNVVSTALGFAPVNYVTSGGDPRQFAQSEVGAGAMGGIFGLAGDRARLENVAQYRLAKYGSQQFTENPAWQAHQDAMNKFSPEDQTQINALRGYLNAGTGTDLLVLDGPNFAKQVGAIGGDARGQYAASPDGGTVYLNADAISNAGPIDAAGHESGHAIVDFLKNAGREGDAQHLFSSISDAIPPDQIQAISDAYVQKLANSTPGYKTGTPSEKAVIERRITQANPPEKIIEENLAEITRNILSGKSIGSFALPQPILERVTDAASSFMENKGWMPAIDPNASLGFKAQMVNEAARRMNAILYETGKTAAAKMEEGPTVTQQLIEAKSKLASVQPITPNMPVASATAIQRQRDAAQKEINQIQGMLRGEPTQPETPEQPTPTGPNLNRFRIAAILRQQGLNQVEAKQWADSATGATDEEAVVNALRARANQKYPTTSTLEVQLGQKFNDENGIPYKVTGENTDPARIGDTVVATDGKAYRVTKVWDNGSVDVAYTTSPLNTRPANTLRQGSFKRVNVEPDVQPTNPAPGQQIPSVTEVPSVGGAATQEAPTPVAAGTQNTQGVGGTSLTGAQTLSTKYPQHARDALASGRWADGTHIDPIVLKVERERLREADEAASKSSPTSVESISGESKQPSLTIKPAGGGRFVILDAAGNPINSRTYASEASANAAIRQQGNRIQLGTAPGGAKDILNHIDDMGGIAPKKATLEYDDMPALHKGFSAILGGSEAPEDLARDLHDDHNIGDGSVSTMWKLVQEAMDNRRNSTIKQGPTDAAQERQGRANAENHVADLLKTTEEAATAAEKNPKTKAAKDRIQRAKINAILDDIGDDPTGIHRVTDQFGNESIIGDYDPTDPRHKAIAEMGGLSAKDGQKVAAIQGNKGNVLYMRYRSATSNAEQAQALTGEANRENVETGMQKRGEEYAADPAQERTQGTIQQKAVIPIGTEVNSPSGKVTMKFMALDNILHNVASIFEGMKQIGRPNPYGETPQEQQGLILQDAQAYAQNHAHGYKGDGSGPMQTFPDSGLPSVDADYTPQQVPSDRFAVLNMAFANESAGKLGDVDAKVQKYQAEGKAVPKSVMGQWSKAQELYALSADNGTLYDRHSGETNQLRAELKASGFDTEDRLKKPFETLAPQHILETSDKPIAMQPGDVPTVRPTGFSVDPAELGKKGLPIQKAIASGFLPDEDTGNPEQGRNPGERLGREAEAAGIILSMTTLKGLMQQDQATMDNIRRRIEVKTGKPAQFLPIDDQRSSPTTERSSKGVLTSAASRADEVKRRAKERLAHGQNLK